jgi:hypothetical protein
MAIFIGTPLEGHTLGVVVTALLEAPPLPAPAHRDEDCRAAAGPNSLKAILWSIKITDRQLKL